MTTVDAGSSVEVSLAVISAYVRKARDAKNTSGVIALRARPQWPGPESFEVDGESVRVAACVSSLAAREALMQRGRSTWLVLLTDRAEDDLGDGVVAHLIGQRVRTPLLWEVVQERFQALHLDPLLLSEGQAVAAALLAEAPPEGWPPARGGLLTRDAAFEALVARVLHLPADRLDELGLLEWTLGSDPESVLERLGAELRLRLATWLGERIGPVGQAIFTLAGSGRAADAVALGLAMGLLVDAGDAETAEARGVLYARQLGQRLADTTATRWAEASRTVVERQLAAGVKEPTSPLAERILDRGEELLAEVGAMELADRSDILPRGFVTRLRHFGHAVATTLDAEAATATPPQAEEAATALFQHLLGDYEPWRTRVDRARMALRLARWLATGEQPAPVTIAAAVERQVLDDGWVDRACAHVWAGDADPVVAEAYRRLYEVVRARRAHHDEQTAALLAQHTAADAAPGDLLHAEDVVRGVVAPLARKIPVLLLVLDGMSAAVATELVDELGEQGWIEFLPHGRQRRRGVLTALPSVTEVTRTSLLTGTLARGGQAEERKGLVALARNAGIGAALFHKSDLDASGTGATVPPPVRDAIGDTLGQPLVRSCVGRGE